MRSTEQQLAHEIRELTDKLSVGGWDRLCGLRLVQAATRVIEECNRVNWLEAIGRASELTGLFGEFAEEAPNQVRLKSILQTATALADLLDAGQHATPVERNFLPARPGEWLFVLASNVSNSNVELAGNLANLGFPVTRVESIHEVIEAWLTSQVILIADASWVIGNKEYMAAILQPTASDSFPASLLLVAIADTYDFRIQAKARQLGARLLLDSWPDATHLITKLGGLAWMPSKTASNAHAIVSVTTAGNANRKFCGLSDCSNGLLSRTEDKDVLKTGQKPNVSIMGEAQRRILVAEDNPANQAVLRMQLDVLGYATDIVGDGATAMLKWRTSEYDLILVDLNMPVMDGLELTRAIRTAERESGAHIPVIAITAAQHLDELLFCRQAGMDDVLPKPIELDALHNILEQWLSHDSPLTPCNNAAVQAAKNKAILDTDCLTRIIGSADAKQTRELIELFTTTACNDLSDCRWHLTENNGHTVSLIMHKLKSSARMVGALSFAHLAERLEETIKAGRVEAAATLLTELEHALDDVETAVTQLGILTAPAVTAVDTVPIAAEMLPSRVLIVDGDSVARRQIIMLLSSLGVHEVLAVDGAEAALAAIAGRSIDLLISDLNMLGMDGIELLCHLADNNYQGYLIIAGGVEEQLLQAAAEMARAKGMNLCGILKKPVMRDALLQLLAAFCKTVTPALQREASTITPDDIQEGIRRNKFDVHFQPKVDAITLSVVGMEALARWQHNGKMVSPDVFISMAEQHGLIGPLSEVLVTKALVGGVLLAEAGYSLTIAVNLSANWLPDIRLPEFISACVQATGFKAENLVLEITENGAVNDTAAALDVMTRLRLKKFKLSIDDFGTGYSSIEQLQSIPFSELKLDRSFVQGATGKKAARTILASALAMARKLKLSTVAEGVESQEDLDLVRGLGCNLVQGWFVAKAMPVDQLLMWLKERNA